MGATSPVRWHSTHRLLRMAATSFEKVGLVDAVLPARATTEPRATRRHTFIARSLLFRMYHKSRGRHVTTCKRRCWGLPCGRFRDDVDLEELGPVFTGDENAVVGRIVGDTVEHVDLGLTAVGIGEEAGAIDPSFDFSGGGVDARDAVGLPDVGEDFALDEF